MCKYVCVKDVLFFFLFSSLQDLKLIDICIWFHESFLFCYFFAVPFFFFFFVKRLCLFLGVHQTIEFSDLGIDLCKLCSQFNLQVGCFIFCPLKPMTPAPLLATPNDWAGGAGGVEGGGIKLPTLILQRL